VVSMPCERRGLSEGTLIILVEQLTLNQRANSGPYCMCPRLDRAKPDNLSLVPTVIGAIQDTQPTYQSLPSRFRVVALNSSVDHPRPSTR